MSNIERNPIFSSNSLLPMSFLIMAAFSNPIQEMPKSNTILPMEVSHNVTDVFKSLPSPNITFEQSQMDILVSFVSKLVNESTDLDAEIVDMVNKHFWDLI